MSKNQRDRRSLVGVKNAELWERWQRGPNASLNRLSRLSFPRTPTGQGIGKLAALTTARELNERQKRPWNPKPWQSDLPQVLRRPVEMAAESGHSPQLNLPALINLATAQGFANPSVLRRTIGVNPNPGEAPCH